MRIVSRVLAIAGYAVLAVGCALVLGHFEPVRVSGGSMRPTLIAGDLVFVDRSAPPSTGDIALIRTAGHGPVLHRIIDGESRTGFRTQGDANETADVRPVRRSEVEGVVVRVIPLGTFLERWQRR